MSSAFRTVMHALDLEEEDWILALFAEGRSVFDEGHGLFVYSYRVGSRPPIRLGALAGKHTAPALWRTLSSWGSEHARVLARTYTSGAGGIAARSDALHTPIGELLSRFEAHGIADLLTVIAHDPSGAGVFVTAPRPKTVSLDAARRRGLERLSFELGATLRLREARQKANLRRLSTSERAVFRLLANGASDKEIASALGVGLSTVSTFARRARNKLGCRPGTEALLTTTPGAERQRCALFAKLTPSECDIAADLLVGRSYSEIAAKRASCQRTVAAQCAAIFRKCGVAGRRELAAAMLTGTAPVGKMTIEHHAGPRDQIEG